MTTDPHSFDQIWVDEDWMSIIDWDVIDRRYTAATDKVVILAAVLVAVLLAWGAMSLFDRSQPSPIPQAIPSANNIQSREDVVPLAPPLVNPPAIISPYDAYIVTQGVHGLSYGHMAVDIAAGKGAIIRSPINGTVSELFIDGIGNPTLVIENNDYRVTLLHGIYKIKLGDRVEMGDDIGVESNIGNTRDMQGNSCRNRDCGYHTHLNIFDKQANINVDPIDLLNL